MSRFDVWSPIASAVDLVLTDRAVAMAPTGSGWWSVEVAGTAAGTDYGFRLETVDSEASDDDVLPDPRSPWQPAGVHALSRTVDHAAFAWTDGVWHGTPLSGAVLYELHVGTFTPAGTFDAAIAHLDHLASLGITAIELLPVNGFDGERGWGYDGVALYAVHEPYGGPAGLKRLVDACHARGLGVVLDVVYNHLGPSGNYLSRFGPYFTATHTTPWGPAVNLDAPGSDQVRAFIIDNALMWLRDYHLDGLRLDAVHALVDERAVHILEELAGRVEQLAVHTGRPLFLVAESDLNNPRVVTHPAAGGYGITGQWCDDVHHALHATLTGELQGYYADFGGLAVLAKALRGAFVHDDAWSSFRGRHHGRPVPDTVPGFRFVTYLQDHDQVGNRATGDRHAATLTDGQLMVGAALLACSPFTPMLFMGEEYGARTPWQFFTSFEDPDLAEAVRTGRRSEFAEHGWAPGDVPDPQAESTFTDSTLDWSEASTARGQSLYGWWRDLLALRRSDPALSGPRTDVACTYSEDAHWFVLRRGPLALAVNFHDAEQRVPLPTAAAAVLLSSAAAPRLDGDGVPLPGQSCAVVRLGAEPA